MYLPLSIQNQLSDLVSRNGWQAGLDLFIHDASAEYVLKILNEIRLRHTAWVGLLNLNKIDTAYVFDFSLGATAVTLSRFISKVHAVYRDECTRNLLASRLDYLGINNVEMLHVKELDEIASLPENSLLVGYQDSLDLTTFRRFWHLLKSSKGANCFCVAGDSLANNMIFRSIGLLKYYIEGSSRSPFNYVGDQSKKLKFGALKYYLFKSYSVYRGCNVALTNFKLEDSIYYIEIRQILANINLDTPFQITYIYFVKPYGALLELDFTQFKLMARFPLSDDAARKYRSSAKLLLKLAAFRSPLIPNIIFEGYGENFYVCIETGFEGNNIDRHYLCNQKSLCRIYQQAFDLLVSFHSQSCSREIMSKQRYVLYILSTIDLVENQFDLNVTKIFAKIRKYLADKFTNQTISFVTNHGDYSIDNLMLIKDRVTGLVDWEHARERGLPLIDLLIFIASIYKKRTGCSIEHALEDVVLNSEYTVFEKELIFKYCTEFEIDPQLLPAYSVVSVLEFLRYRLHFNSEVNQISLNSSKYLRLIKKIDDII